MRPDADKGMLSTNSDEDPSKQIRVRLPVEVILRLQEIRITQGRPVADVVQAALREYFERLGARPGMNRGPPASNEERDER